ncbi:MAG TPA: tetratricopeptide repeat protein, partial [Anaeromyxobacteraceae bacterium]|nr:tetratricopeptide repeat protein [Anaeromyxobacteraceae bacterium]
APARAAASPAPRPANDPAPAQPAAVGTARNAAYAEELAERYATREFELDAHGIPAPRRRGSSKALVATLGLGAAFLVVLGVYFGVSSAQKAKAVEMDRLLRQTRELLEKDGYASYKEAGRLCERILERDPDALGGHAYLAYIDAIRWGEHGESESLRDEARLHLAAVKKLGHAHSHAYAAEAYLRHYSGDGPAALEELRKLMAGPEGASALLRGVTGILEMQAGDLDAAKNDLTLARTAAPGDVRVTQMLAEQYRRRGQGFEALASGLYDTALTRLAPDHVPSLLGKGRLLLDAGRADEAMKRVQRVLELGPAASPRQAALATALKGSILHAQGKASEGDAAEAQALAQDPTNPDIHDLVGRRKLLGGDAAGAAEAFHKAIQLEPSRLAFHADLAAALMQRPGGTKQAVAALEKATERVANPRLSKLLGDAYRADGDLDRARTAYEKAIAGEKRFPEARVGLARIWRDRKEWSKALEELDRAAKEYGETGAPGAAAAAWVEIAETEEQRGASPEAVEKAYTAALKVDPQSCPALYWLGRSRSEKKSRLYDRPLAKQMLSDYVRLCPRGPHAAEAQRIVGALH